MHFWPERKPVCVASSAWAERYASTDKLYFALNLHNDRELLHTRDLQPHSLRNVVGGVAERVIFDELQNSCGAKVRPARAV